MAKKKTAAVLDLPVAFGNVSIGDKTARIVAYIAARFEGGKR
jgi:hypothetical protein